MKGDSKYQPLLEYLRQCDRSDVCLTFAEIERLMGVALPDSARQQRAWWSNRSRGALQAAAWRGADYLVHVLDLDGEAVTFRKPPARYTVQQVNGAVIWNGELVKALRLHMKLTQNELADKLGVRQQTVSEWEKGVYRPTRSTSKHLMIVADQSGFPYGSEEDTE